MSADRIVMPLPIINKRSPEMWSYIKDLDFVGKTVVDLGCGYCDLLGAISGIGKANYCMGIESDFDIYVEVQQRLRRYAPHLPIYIHNANVQADLNRKWPGFFDYAICTSVLPYLTRPDSVLRWMSENTHNSIIEVQYAGDGPGFIDIKNDEDFHKRLSAYWGAVEIIGKTTVVGRFVEGRQVERTIWLLGERP